MIDVASGNVIHSRVLKAVPLLSLGSIWTGAMKF